MKKYLILQKLFERCEYEDKEKITPSMESKALS